MEALDLPTYQIFADDVMVWQRREKRPTQNEVDRTAIYATERGWNGTVLELHVDGQFQTYLYPSQEALS